MWKFCGKEQFPHSFGWSAQNYAETAPFHIISTPGNYVKLRYFLQCHASHNLWPMYEPCRRLPFSLNLGNTYLLHFYHPVIFVAWSREVKKFCLLLLLLNPFLADILCLLFHHFMWVLGMWVFTVNQILIKLQKGIIIKIPINLKFYLLYVNNLLVPLLLYFFPVHWWKTW